MADFIYIDGVEYRPSEELVNKIKEYLTSEEKCFDKAQYHVWHLCEIEEPKKSGYYTIAVDTKGMTSYIDMAYYDVDDECWKTDDTLTCLYVDVYDFPPRAWTKIEFPDYLSSK